jgi:hypothetical protein
MVENNDDRKMAKEFLAKYPNKPEEKEKKTSKINYLSPKRVLPRKEYKVYKNLRIQTERRRYQEKIKKLDRENKYYERKQRYEKSRTGRIGSSLTRGYKTLSSRGGVTRALYRRQGQLPPEAMQRIRQIVIQRQIEKNNYDWTFSNFTNPRFNMARMVESEVMNTANGGHAIAGDREAFNIGREAFGFSNIGTNSNLFNQLTKEVNHHSKNLINPYQEISLEADIFSNILP